MDTAQLTEAVRTLVGHTSLEGRYVMARILVATRLSGNMRAVRVRFMQLGQVDNEADLLDFIADECMLLEADDEPTRRTTFRGHPGEWL